MLVKWPGAVPRQSTWLKHAAVRMAEAAWRRNLLQISVELPGLPYEMPYKTWHCIHGIPVAFKDTQGNVNRAPQPMRLSGWFSLEGRSC